MSSQEKEKCPLCLEVMDLTDRQLKPCNCGYEICLWCWHHILEMDQKDECGGRCPGCRTIYDKDRILGTSISNKILKDLCTGKSNLQKEQSKYQKQKSTKNQLQVENEPKDPSTVRVVQRKLVYIVGMPSEFASEKILRQKKFLGQYGKIENIIIDNIGANLHIPDSGRVYVTFSTEAEAVRCIQAVNGYILDGRILKATFGVTRYCHIWLSNKVCRKPNCSYVHHKVSPEDMCSKDDVASMCARLQQLLGMDLKGPQQRSGSTLPSPGDCSGRATICSGNSRDNIYANDGELQPYGGNKNPGTLPAATPWDLSSPFGSSSSAVNAVLQRQSEHASVLSNHLTSDAKSQKLAMPGHSCSSIKEMRTSVKHLLLSSGPTEGTFLQCSKNANVVSQGPSNCSMKQLASGDARSQASVQLGKDTSSSKKMTSAEDDNIDITGLRKPQNINVVSQRSSGCLTVLGRLLASNDARPKASGQVGNESKNLISVENESSDSITLPGQERDGCSSTNEKPLQGNHMQILETIALHSPTALQSLSDNRAMHSNHLSYTEVKSQTSGSEEFLNSNSRSISGNQLQLLNQQKPGHLLPSFQSVDTDVPRPMDCPSILDDQLSSADGQHQKSTRGDHCLYSRTIIVSGDHLQIAAQHTESTLLRRPHSVNCSTEKVAQHGKESNPNGRVINSLVSESSCLMPRYAHSHGIKELLQSFDSDKRTCSALCSTSDDNKPDPCGILDPSDMISWVSECLEDDVDATQCDNSLSISSSLSSDDAIWRCTQIPVSVSGASNHHLLSPYPSGLPCIAGVENTMRCGCALPFVSTTANQKPEHWNGTGSGYMSNGGFAFSQHPMSTMKAARVDTFLQQSPPPRLYHDWTNGNADSSLSNPQADFSYRMYSLF